MFSLTLGRRDGVRRYNPFSASARYNPWNPIARVNPFGPIGKVRMAGTGIAVRNALGRVGGTASDQIDRMEDFVDRTESRRLVGIGFAMLGIGFLLGAVLAGVMRRGGSSPVEEEKEEKEEKERGRASFRGNGRRRAHPTARGIASQASHPGGEVVTSE